MAENVRENSNTGDNIERNDTGNHKDMAENIDMTEHERADGQTGNTEQAGTAGGQQPMTIEETLKELEAIIEKMEDRSSSLEDTFAWYETGMKMVRECSEKIERVEKKIRILSEEGQDGEF